MPSFELSTDITASPEDVWGLLCDVDRYPEWITVTEAVLGHDDGDVRTGYRYRERGGIPPFIGESNWTVTAFEPHTRQIHVGDDGAVEITLEIELIPTDGGTRLRQRLAFRPRWYLVVPMTILWALMMKRRGLAAIGETQANAKRILEA